MGSGAYSAQRIRSRRQGYITIGSVSSIARFKLTSVKQGLKQMRPSSLPGRISLLPRILIAGLLPASEGSSGIMPVSRPAVYFNNTQGQGSLS